MREKKTVMTVLAIAGVWFGANVTNAVLPDGGNSSKVIPPTATGGDNVTSAVAKDGSGQENATPIIDEALKKLNRGLGSEVSKKFEITPRGITAKELTVTNSEGPIILTSVVYLGWYPTNSNYAARAAEAVEGIYQSNSVPGAISDHVLKAEYVAQPASGYGLSVWATVHGVSKTPGYKMLPGNFTFIGSSADNLLNKTNSFNNPSYVYTSASRGILWKSSDHRSAANVYAAGLWKDTPLDEFISAGAASKFFLTSPSYDLAAVANYLNSFTDYNVTLKWVYYDGTNNPASVSITLHTKVQSALGIMSIQQVDASTVALGLTGGAQDSWVLQSASTPNGVWLDEASVNGGDTFLRAMAAGKNYWRAKLQ